MSSTSVAKPSPLALYRGLLRAAKAFPNTNMRAYALRRTRETFRMHRDERSAGRRASLLESGINQLAVVRRQSALAGLYPASRTVADRP